MCVHFVGSVEFLVFRFGWPPVTTGNIWNVVTKVFFSCPKDVNAPYLLSLRELSSDVF